MVFSSTTRKWDNKRLSVEFSKDPNHDRYRVVNRNDSHPGGAFLYGEDEETLDPTGDSPYCCVDMACNVFEWTASPSGKYYVLRGGSFNHGGELAHCTSRVRHKLSCRFKNLGFRVAETRRE
jgi:formylglycine-generating enzyme required for sulfatase activity